MSLWVLASATVAVFAAVFTGRVWLILLACAYATAIIGRYLWLTAAA